MKFEKISENKIRITLNTQDLMKKNIDFHSFLSNSTESQDLFLDMLKTAEKEVGFVTDDYKIMVEAVALTDGKFILTVTRIPPDIKKSKEIVHIRKKRNSVKTNQALLYSFNKFDDFCDFCNFLEKRNCTSFSKLAKKIVLYSYNDKYYLILTNLNPEFPNLKLFCSTITEFGSFVDSSDLYARKVIEYGSLYIKNNAITTCMKYF